MKLRAATPDWLDHWRRGALPGTFVGLALIVGIEAKTRAAKPE
ncbi:MULTISPECIES: hypothetical protein [Paenibacillus]|nr:MULTISPECIES: hypothetical protein [Paenibacillus]